MLIYHLVKLYNKIDPSDMAQNVAAYAALTWIVANLDDDFRSTE